MPSPTAPVSVNGGGGKNGGGGGKVNKPSAPKPTEEYEDLPPFTID